MIVYLVLFFILGTAVGSFLNVVIDRVTRGETILGRSYCEHCRASLATVDLIPIVSFVALGRRCRYCRQKLSWQYPVVETASGVLFAGVFYHLARSNQLGMVEVLYFCFLMAIVVIVAAVDLKYSLIPTTFVFFALLVSLFYNYFTLSSTLFIEHIISAFGAALFFWRLFL